MARIQTAVFRLFLVVTVSAVTFLATTRQESAFVQDISDKINHAAAFYVLAFLVDFSFPATYMGVRKILPLLSYGLAIEIAQSFVPERTPSSLDVFADVVGIALYKLSVPLLKRVPFLNLRWQT
jgi:VanZ family protein